MSVIRKEPFIQKLIKDLTAQQKTSLLGVINGEKDLVNASFSNMPADAITPVLFQLDNQNSKTGILVSSSHYRVLIAYHRFQDLLMIKLNSNNTYEKINEYLDINELRRLVEEADDHIVASEIDSGSATENQVLAADGDGGAEWVDVADTIKESNVDTGDAVKLFGFDSEGNLVADDLPEGILVDNTVIEDSPNAVSGGAVYDELVDIKEDITDINGDLETKANVDGNYPTMTVGFADALTPYDADSGDDQDEPFSFQATGTGNGTQPDFATGSTALMKEKRGNSVVVNQKLRNPNFTNTDNWTNRNGTNFDLSASNNVLSVVGKTTSEITSAQCGIQQSPTIPVGHKVLVMCSVLSSVSGVQIEVEGCGGYQLVNADGQWHNVIYIGTENSATPRVYAYIYGSFTNSAETKLQIKDFYAIDLTQWFGSNDAIPSDLLSHPENFFRYYQGSLAYNTGELVNANGRYVKCIGRNQWDEEWEVGGIDVSTGQPIVQNTIRSKNYIRVIPNATYHFNENGVVFFYDYNHNYIGYGDVNNSTFVIPNNCLYLRFRISTDYGTTYNHDITISLYYEDESGYDQYYPYEVLTNNDTGIETLRSAGSISDIKKPDGSIVRRVGTYTMGNNEGILIDSYTNITYLQVNNPSGCKQALNKIVFSSKYGLGQYLWPFDDADLVGKMLTNADDLKIWFGFTKGTSLADAQAAVAGTVLNYELATPTEEQGTPYSENLFIDDFGSMDFAGTNGVPQGNLIFYPVDYKAFIDTLYNYTDGTPSELAKKSDLSADKTELQGVDTQLLNAIGGTLRQCLCVKETLDFEDTDFVDLGTLSWSVDTGRFFASISNMTTGTTRAIKMICSKYVAITDGRAYDQVPDKSCYGTASHEIYVVDSSYTDVTAFKNAMKGVLLAYEKASE